MLCAAIPYRESEAGGIQVLLVTSRGKGNWIVPKGKVNPGTTAAASAAQEAYEEAGVTGKVDQAAIMRVDLPSTHSRSALERKQMQIFSLEVEGLALTWPEMFQRQRRWFSLQEAVEIVKGSHLRKALRAFAAERVPVM